MSNRIKDKTGGGQTAAIPALDDYDVIDSKSSNTRRLASQFRAFGRNFLSPRGGIVSGNSNNQSPLGFAPLSNANHTYAIGTDEFSVSFVLEVAAANLAINGNPAGILHLCNNSGDPSSATGGLFAAYLDASWNLNFAVMTDGSNYNLATLTNFFSKFAGHVVHITFVRNKSGNPSIYINGVAPATSVGSVDSGEVYVTFSTVGTAPSWQGTVNATYCTFGAQHSVTQNYSVLRNTKMSCAALYNMALAAADAQEIFELGGFPPERFKFGSTVNLWPQPSFNSTSGIGVNTAYNGGTFALDTSGASYDGSSGLVTVAAQGGPGPGYVIINSGATPTRFRTYKYSFLAKTDTPGSISGISFATAGGSGQASFSLTTSWAAYSSVGTAGWSDGSMGLGGDQNHGGSPIQNWFDNMSIYQAGAIALWPMEDGVGLQLRDVSGNGFHVILDGTTAHIIPERRGTVRFATNTNGNQQACAASCIPQGCRILAIAADAASGTPTVKLGQSSGAADVVASVTLAGGLNDLTLAMKFTTGANLWVNSNSTDIINWTIEYAAID